jgi:hypothetical protein
MGKEIRILRWARRDGYAEPHGVASQKTAVFIVTAVRSSNLT